MTDIYFLVRQALWGFLQGADPQIPQDALCFSARDCEVSTSMPYRMGISSKACMGLLLALPQPQVWGVPLVREIFASGNHIGFRLSDAFYAEAVRRICADAPLPALPEEWHEEPEYALCRMRMLARKAQDVCPASDAVHRALWLAFAMAQENPKRKSRRVRAARALLHMFDKWTPANETT